MFSFARPIAPGRIEFTCGPHSGVLLLQTGSSLPVALHGHITVPQLLSVTGLVNLGLAGTSTLLCWCESQSHWVGLSALKLVCGEEPGPMAQAGIALGLWPVGLEWIDGLMD